MVNVEFRVADSTKCTGTGLADVQKNVSSIKDNAVFN